MLCTGEPAQSKSYLGWPSCSRRVDEGCTVTWLLFLNPPLYLIVRNILCVCVCVCVCKIFTTSSPSPSTPAPLSPLLLPLLLLLLPPSSSSSSLLFFLPHTHLPHIHELIPCHHSFLLLLRVNWLRRVLYNGLQVGKTISDLHERQKRRTWLQQYL